MSALNQSITRESTDMSQTEVKRGKVCSICGGVNESYHLNYGASSCLSCRAFFRRALGRSQNPQLKCKMGGNCVITVENRHCRKCRFAKCLAAGMRKDLVMNDGEKVHRFRKLLKTQRLVEDKTQSPKVVRYKKTKPDVKLIVGHEPWNKEWLTMVDAEMDMAEFQEALQGRGPVSRKLLLKHLVRIKFVVNAFLVNSDIAKSDQGTLFRSNVLKIICLALGQALNKHFSSDDSMQWILCGKRWPRVEEDETQCKQNPPGNLVTLLSPPPDMLKGLELSVKKLNLSPESFGTMVVALLLHDHESLFIEDIATVEAQWRQAQLHLKGLRWDHLAEWLDSFKSNVLSSWFPELIHDENNKIASVASATSSVAIELKISKDLKLLDESIRSISYGEEAMMECLMFNLDVPLTRRFYTMIARIWSERSFDLFRRCYDIRGMTTQQQNACLSALEAPSLALVQAIMEALPNGEEQVKFACGHTDVELFIEKYRSQLPGNTWKAMTVQSMNAYETLFSEETQKAVLKCTNSLCAFVRDETTFRLLLLYSISACVNLVGFNHVNVYLRYMKNHLAKLGFSNPTEVMSNCIESTNQLTHVICPTIR
eukprot:TCALIF_03531-PA protein Name:"Similar to vdrb Vitamin D3 receptor B (Danio rerio)" AED:0.24 eAED:0.29 QI:0/0/0/0.5/1/1/2/0/597